MSSRETCLPVTRLCINCDNRHGCRSPVPPCLGLTRTAAERRLSGKALLSLRGLLAECRRCADFERCWSPEDFRAACKPAQSPPVPA